MNETNNLLGPEEEPPYTLINADGKAPMMIACDHASNQIPKSLCGLGVSTEMLGQHVALDIGAKQVATLLTERFDAPLLSANYSRLVVDLNRHFGDPEMFPEVSDGYTINGNQCLSANAKKQRIDALFTPYHNKHSQMVQALKQRFSKPIILSVHSFTGRMNGFQRPWHFGVLWDQHAELAEQLIRNFERIGETTSPQLSVGDNQPYHARKPLGYSLVEHATNQNTEMALIEIRQDLVSHDDGQRWAADILYEVIKPLLDHSEEL